MRVRASGVSYRQVRARILQKPHVGKALSHFFLLAAQARHTRAARLTSVSEPLVLFCP